MRKSLKRSSRQKVAALTLAMVSCLSLPVFAEEKKDEATVTREVLVTASRTQQELKETPTSAEVITREEIETIGAQTVQEALRLATGIKLPKGTVGGNEVNIRGMSSQHTLILVNGRRMGGEDGGTLGGRYELSRININNVERIEIIRGPGSALYGSDALGGVVNIITRKPEESQFRVNMATGSDEQSLGFNYDLGQDGKWNWTVGANFVNTRKRGTLDLGRQLSILPYGSRAYYNIEGTYDLTENKKIDVFFERTREKPTYLGASSTYYTEDRYDGYRNSYGIAYRGTGEKSDYELRTYVTVLNRWNNKYRNGVTPSSTDYRKYTNWIVDGKNSMQLSEKHLMTFGGEIRSLKYKGTNINSDGKQVGWIRQNTGAAKAVRKKTTDYQALYVQDEWLVSDKFLVIPSLRYDHNSEFGNHYSPKIGMNYKFTDNYRLKANYGKGFRAPSLSEMFMDMDSAMAVVISNPDLKPEAAKSFDISFEADISDTSMKATYFHNDVKNLISLASVTTRIYQYANVEKAKVEGFELEVTQKISDNFDIKATYVNLSAKNKETNTKLNFRADDIYTVQLRYHDNKAAGIDAVLWYEYKDNFKRATDDFYSYGTVNFSINKKFNDKVSAYFGLDNIFNKKVDLLYEYGRSWRVGVNLTI